MVQPDTQAMGPGGAVDVARAAAAGASLRAWGGAIGEAIAETGLRVGGATPPALADGLARLRPVERDLVHTIGWELRDAFVWRNDDRCIQRAVFGALSLAEREAGDLRSALGQLGHDDALSAAMTVTYTPTFGNARLHSAVLARTVDDDFLVIDHLFADADDGVLTLAEWMRRTGATDASTTVVSPLRQPPYSITNGGPGIPISARPRTPDDWPLFGDHLASAWDESATRGLPQLERVHPR